MLACACVCVRVRVVGHRLSSYTQTSSLAEPSIGPLIGSLEAGQLEGGGGEGGVSNIEMHASSPW